MQLYIIKQSIEMIISVEGNIGSGKSTLVDNLKRHLSNKEIKSAIDDVLAEDVF